MRPRDVLVPFVGATTAMLLAIVANACHLSLFRGEGFSLQTQCIGYGLLLLQLVQPEASRHTLEIRRGGWERVRRLLPPKTSKPLVELLQAMLRKTPERRPTCEEILDFPWVRDRRICAHLSSGSKPEDERKRLKQIQVN